MKFTAGIDPGIFISFLSAHEFFYRSFSFMYKIRKKIAHVNGRLHNRGTRATLLKPCLTARKQSFPSSNLGMISPTFSTMDFLHKNPFDPIGGHCKWVVHKECSRLNFLGNVSILADNAQAKGSVK